MLYLIYYIERFFKKCLTACSLSLVIASLYAQEDSSRQIKLFTSSVEELLQIPVKEAKEVSIASNIVKDIDKQPASVTVISNERNLYPMNSNAGCPDVSPGTPGWESTTFWTTLRLKL